MLQALIVTLREGVEAALIVGITLAYINKIGRPGVVVLAGLLDERVSLQVSVSAELTRRGLHAGKIAGAVGQKLGGKGGGRPESAQGGGKDKAQLGAALDLVAKFVKENVQ